MYLTEATNEEALDALAELLEPCEEIFTDAELKAMFDKNESQMVIIRHAIKNHKQAIIKILAVLDGVPVEEYKCNVLTIPVKLIELLNNKELAPFFHS